MNSKYHILQGSAFYLGTAIGAWFLPQRFNLQLTLPVVCMCITFDLLSLCCYLGGIRAKRNISGVTVSVLFYPWFLIAAKYALTALKETQIGRILLFKVLDGLILFGFFYLCHFPARFMVKFNSLQDRNDDRPD
jgi:hypothetical protein